MATPSDEILLKLAVDLGDVKTGFQDLSKLTQDRINETNEAEKRLKSYGDTAVKEAERVNKAFQKNVDSIREEVAVIGQLEKATKSFFQKNSKLFDIKNLDEFKKKADELFKSLSKDLGLTFDASELDNLSKELIATKNDLEATAKVVEFFEQKLKDAGEAGAVSMAQLKHEIQDIKDYITQTEREIKALDKQIEAAAPGRMQAGLIQERERLNKSVQEAKLNLEGLNQEYKELQAETAKTSQAQKSLQAELRHTKDEMVRLEAEGKRNTSQYEELRDKATQYQRSIRDVNQEVQRSASHTAGLQNLIGLVNGVVGVYATAQGAAALFGSESEDLNKTIQKLGGALAVLNGLQATQAELANRSSLANRGLVYVQRQYALATDASAKSTLRLRAAFNLLGIGLIVSALAAAVVYWKDIAKWMGIVSEESERNASITKLSNELYGEQIAQLTVLNKQIKEGGLSFKQKETAVKEFNDTFGKTLGSVKDYNELEARMIKNGDTYIKYVKLKAQAEATYQLAIESTMKAIQDRERVLNKDFTLYERFSLMLERGASNLKSSLGFSGERAGDLTDEDFEFLMGLPNEKDVERFLSQYSLTNRAILEKYYEDNKSSDSLLNRQSDYLSALDELAKLAGDIVPDAINKSAKATKDLTAEINKLVNELIRMQEAYAIGLIDNDREREIALRRQQFEEEKKGLQDQINAIKVSNERKLRLQREFNKLYNEENGLAYQAMVRDLEEIDRQYEEQAREAHMNALIAINEVYNLSEKNEIDAIKRRWDAIRKELRRQIQLTEDEGLKDEINALLGASVGAEETETNKKLLEQSFERVEREKKIADSYIKIWQSANSQMVESDRIAKEMMLANELGLQNALLDEIRKANPEKVDLLNESIQTLITSDNIQDFEIAGDTLRDAFGDELYEQILKIAEAIAQINKETKELTTSEKGNIGNWFKSTTSFATELGRALGAEGEQLKYFGETVGRAIEQAWGAMQQMVEMNIMDHQNKLAEIDSMIHKTEALLDRERDLYEQGYANNYDLRKQELEDLKKQKAEEKKELEKAQKQQAAINKAQMLSNLAVQVSETITAATKIMNGTSSVPFVGVALGIGLVASLFAALAAFKSQAQSFTSFRTGLKQGGLTLDGASHERGGMGLYDSASGRKVAEYEGGEQLYALNKEQQSRYGWLMQMMIDDAKGRKPIMDSLIGRVPVTGKKTIRKVREVNEITRSAHKKRAEASNEQLELIKEVQKLNKRFDEELGGFKNRETEKTEYWEDPHFFYVKKNGILKKYKKNTDE